MINTSEETFMGWPIKGEGIPDGFQRCPDCGELVGAGLLPRIKHWGDCGGKGQAEAMRSHIERTTSFDLNNIIREEYLKKYPKMKSGIELIAEERTRQVEVEKWTAKHDQGHWDGSLAKAAACYALQTTSFERHFGTDENFVKLQFDFWPWNRKWWKPVPDGTTEARIRNMVKAGALIAAEIDRLQNLNK